MNSLKVMTLIAAVFLYFMPVSAWAINCWGTPSVYPPVYTAEPLTSTIHTNVPGAADPISVPPNTIPGTTLGNLTPDQIVFPGYATGPYGVIGIICSNGGMPTSFSTYGVGSYNPTYRTYATNVPGIGVRLYAGTLDFAFNGALRVLTCQGGGTCIGTTFSTGQLSRVEIVATGPVTTGGTLLGPLAMAAISPSQGTIVPMFEWDFGGVVIIPGNPTCEIMGNATVSVTLPTLKTGDFNSSPNPNSGNSAPIALTVGNCQYNATSATFTFSGTADSDNSTLFKNTGAATGVGVRLYVNDGSNQTITPTGTTSVHTVPVTGNQAVLSLIAQYYKTGASVGAGSVISKVTAVMSYN